MNKRSSFCVVSCLSSTRMKRVHSGVSNKRVAHVCFLILWFWNIYIYIYFNSFSLHGMAFSSGQPHYYIFFLLILMYSFIIFYFISLIL